jgi:hypothetical protein
VKTLAAGPNTARRLPTRIDLPLTEALLAADADPVVTEAELKVPAAARAKRLPLLRSGRRQTGSYYGTETSVLELQ